MSLMSVVDDIMAYTRKYFNYFMELCPNVDIDNFDGPYLIIYMIWKFYYYAGKILKISRAEPKVNVRLVYLIYFSLFITA